MIPADLLDEWTKTTERRDALDALHLLELLVGDVRKYEHEHPGSEVRDGSWEFDAHGGLTNLETALEVIETFIRKHT